MRVKRSFKRSAAWFESMAAALEVAAGHSRAAAGHVRNRDVPRASAHALVAYGHLLDAHDAFESAARHHAGRSSVACAGAPAEAGRSCKEGSQPAWC